MRGQHGQPSSSSARLRVDCLQRGSSGLMYACQQGDLPGVVRILGEEPISAYRQDRNRRTALHYCRGGAVAVPLVSAAPGLLDSPDRDGLTPLHLAVIQGDAALVQLLISQRADVDALDNERHSVVHWATVCGELECLRLLLSAGAHPSAPDVLGGCPLHYAAQLCGAPVPPGQSSGQAIRILRELLAARGTTVHATDHEGRTPLLWAAAAGSAEAVIALVKAGAHVEAADRDGLTALHCAASRGHTGCIETLITLCGASVDVIDCNGCTALHYAATLGHADATSLLLELDAVPDRQDRKGRTPAHCACAKGQLETVKILVSHKANLWIRNIKGDLPLHEAVSSGRRDLVLYLLQRKTGYINASGHDGKTLLHIAASQDHADICKILLDQGASVNPLYRTSRDILVTPLDCALHRGHKSTAKYLQLQGGVPAIRLHADESDKNKSVKLQSIPSAANVKQTKSSVLRSGGRGRLEDERKRKANSEAKTRNRTMNVTTFQDVGLVPISSRSRTKSLSKIHCSSSSDDSNLEEFCTCTHRCHHGKQLHRLESPRKIKRRDAKDARKNSHSDSDIHVRSHSNDDRREKRSNTSMSARRDDRRSSSKNGRQLKSARSKHKQSDSKDYSSDGDGYKKRARERSLSRSSKISRSKRKQRSTSVESESSSEEDSSELYDKYKSRSHSSAKSKTSKRSRSYSRYERTANSSYSEDELSEDRKIRSKSVSSSPRKLKDKKSIKKSDHKSPRHVSEESIVKRKTCKTETTTRRKIKPNSDFDSESESASEESDVELIERVVSKSVKSGKKEKPPRKLRGKKETTSLSDEDEIVADKMRKKRDTRNESRVNEKSKYAKSIKTKKSDGSGESEAEEGKAKKKTQSQSKAAPGASNITKTKKSQARVSKSKTKTEESTGKITPKYAGKDDEAAKKKTGKEKKKPTSSTVSEKKEIISKETKVTQNEIVNEGGVELKVDKNLQPFTTSESELENRSESGLRIRKEVITEVEIHRTKETVVESPNDDDNVKLEQPIEQTIAIEGATVEEIAADKPPPALQAEKDQTIDEQVDQQIITPDETSLVPEVVDNAPVTTAEIAEVIDEKSETNIELDPPAQITEVSEPEKAPEEPPKSFVVMEESAEQISDRPIAEAALDQTQMDNSMTQEPTITDVTDNLEEKPAIQNIEMIQPDRFIKTPERFVQMEYKSGEEAPKKNLYSSDDDTTDSSDDSAKFETSQTPRTAVDEMRFGSPVKFEDRQSGTFGPSSLADTTEPPSVATWSTVGSPSRRKKLKKRAKNRSRTHSEEVSERGYESSGMMDSGFEPSPRIIARAKSGGPRGVNREWKASQDKGTRIGRAKDRKPGDKGAVNMTTVNQTMQANIRRYYTERIIFQHLLELKRLQIRSSRSNEAVLVKRAIDQYHRSGHQVARYTDREFTYEAFEKHLYGTLKKLQNVGSSNYKTIAETFLENERKTNPMFCTTKTFRCNHATHAYTGIPCAAYIPLINHHTIPKPGYPKVPEVGFLPRIKTAERRDKNAVALELSHGNDKQLITLPSDRLDINKKYYVTFSVRGSNPGSEAEGKHSPKLKTPKV